MVTCERWLIVVNPLVNDAHQVGCALSWYREEECTLGVGFGVGNHLHAAHQLDDGLHGRRRT